MAQTNINIRMDKDLKYRIYLDNCCFNRPYDDQSHLTIYLESEAKLFVQKEILLGKFDLVWSYILDYENSVNPYDDRKTAIAGWRNAAVADVGVTSEIVSSANHIVLKGVKRKDALHLACAITTGCQYFLTTDKKLLNKFFDEIIVINPLDFVRKLEA